MNTTDSTTDNYDMERRSVLKGAGALGLGALAAGGMMGMPSAFAADMDMSHHHHGDAPNKEMTAAMYACVAASNACIAHCMELIKMGDTTIIDCLKSTHETAAFCSAHAYLSTANSRHLNAMCELAIQICGDCQKECEKHADKHAACKACAEACADCVKACKAHLHA